MSFSLCSSSGPTLGVLEPHLAADPGHDVVAVPQVAEPLTASRQILDELQQVRIVDVRTHQRPQPGHAVRCHLLPVPPELALGRIQEGGLQQIAALAVHRRQRDRHRVGRKDVHQPVLHIGRRCRPAVDQLHETGRDLVRTAGQSSFLDRSSEPVQVRGCCGTELERPGEGVQHLGGGVLVTTLFEPHVVVAADAREQRQLLTA